MHRVCGKRKKMQSVVSSSSSSTSYCRQLEALFLQKHALLKCVFDSVATVYSTLGCGLKETVYQHALQVELQKQNKMVETERNIVQMYSGQYIGIVRADLVINQEIVLEAKALVDDFQEENIRQLQHYLIQLQLPVGLLVNFRRRWSSSSNSGFLSTLILTRWKDADRIARKQLDDRKEDAVVVNKQLLDWLATKPPESWVCLEHLLPVSLKPDLHITFVRDV